MYTTGRLKCSSSTVMLRCPKDSYERTTKPKPHQQKSSGSRSRLTAASPSHRTPTVRDENADPYLMCKPAQPSDTLESIQLARKKLRNLEFLEGCLNAQIEKLETKNAQPTTAVLMGRYEQSVADYDTVTSNVEQLGDKIRHGQEVLRELRDMLGMSVSDIESRSIQRAEVLLQAEDCEQILAAHAEQFEEQSKLLNRQDELQRELEAIQQAKRTTAMGLEVLELQVKQLQESSQHERNRFLEQKINQLRMNLLDQQSVMNGIGSKHQSPPLRELICLYFTTVKNQPKLEEEALEMWVARRQLVDNFKGWVIQRKDYSRPEEFHSFKSYTDILARIETLYKKMLGSPHQELLDFKKAEEADLMAQYGMWVATEKKLVEEIRIIKGKLQELQAEQKLNQLQLMDDPTSKHFSELLHQLNSEQELRVKSIKHSIRRLRELQERLKPVFPDQKDMLSIQQLRQLVEEQESALRKLRSNYLKLDRSRQSKELQFRRVRDSRTPAKAQQDIEAVRMLYKKLERIQQKKGELKLRIGEWQNKKVVSMVSPSNKALQSTDRQYTTRPVLTTPSNSTTSRSLLKKFHTEYHPLQETIQKLQRLKDSIIERQPFTTVTSRILKF